MTEVDRKARVREYKETPRPAGIFQVRNTVTGKSLIGPSTNLPGTLNGQRFRLESGSHPDRELQADWNELGPEAFEFAVLDELDPKVEGSTDLAAELRLLHEMWLEKLSTGSLYSWSRRGT